MSENTTNSGDIQDTLFSLIRSADMDQGSLLVLLSLVNMMGIINIISYRAGVRSKNEADTVSTPGPPRDAPFDPASLISMLGGKQGPGPGPGNLEGLLKRFMGSPPAQQEVAVQEKPPNGAPPPEGERGG